MATIARQYQSPQWQLELSGTESPLSRWFGQTLLQDIRFALRQIDASGLISWQWRGEQDQLEQLQREFADRVNHLLTRSSLEPLNHDWPQVPGLDMPPKLSTLQLFDLAEVLDQWAADTVALPADVAPVRRFSLPILPTLAAVPTWGRVAASAVAAVGVSAGVFQLFVGGLGSPQVASRPDPTVIAGQPAGTADQSFPGAIVAPGAVPSTLASASPPGLLLLPPVPTGASGTMPLPPMASNTESVPVTGTLPPPAMAQAIPQRSIIPPAMRNARAPIVIAPRPIAPPPAPAPIEPPPLAAAVPSLETAPSSEADQAALRENQAAVAGVSSKAAEPALPRPAAAPIAELPPAEYKVAEPLPNTSQVTEAQAYFKQRWSPQKALTFPLQYRLTIGKDGTVASNEPLTAQSLNWLDRSGVPLQGEPFVSALGDGNEQTIVLTLRSDGGVEAVLEQVK